MNSEYLYDYINLFERVLSVGYKLNYSTGAIERAISYSPFFLKIEGDNNTFAPIVNDLVLVKTLFPEHDIALDKTPVFNQCLWAAEAYLRIQGDTKLTFEAIFLYIPINKMYDFFPVYHEMDFSHIVQEFHKLYEQKTIFALLLYKYGYSIIDVSKETNIPTTTLYSLKSRRRNIKKVSVEIVKSLSSLFNVRLETFAEIQI